MTKEADKQQWDMFAAISTGEELDKATRERELHDTINKVMDKVAPWITIKVNPNYLGKWMTKDFQKEIWEHNNE